MNYNGSDIKHQARVQSSTNCLRNGYDTHGVLSANVIISHVQWANQRFNCSVNIVFTIFT